MSEEKLAKLNSIPRKFQIKANWVSMHNRITIEDMDGHEIGSYHKELVSFKDKYHLNGKDGHTLAVASKSLVSWGVDYSIHNKGNDEKYHIHEKKLSSKVHIGDMFEITKNDHCIAECQKTDLLHEKVTVSEKGRGKCATMTKCWLGLHDTWKISVKETSQVPPWIIGFFASIIQIEEKLKETKEKKEKKEKEEKAQKAAKETAPASS